MQKFQACNSGTVILIVQDTLRILRPVAQDMHFKVCNIAQDMYFKRS